ncbi:MAG: hypothetical protein WBC22_13500, partial [Sedimentisphaerales bacterium]
VLNWTGVIKKLQLVLIGSVLTYRDGCPGGPAAEDLKSSIWISRWNSVLQVTAPTQGTLFWE